MEAAGFENINAAIAAGYSQVTPFVSGKGRHMVLGGLAGLGSLDTVFDPHTRKACSTSRTRADQAVGG